MYDLNATLWGALAALGWGIADFLARYASRAVGAPRSLLGMLVVSAIALTLLVSALELNWSISFWSGLSAAASGLGIAAATLILYWALARGPVSVVAPVCASWPAFNLLFEVIAGGRPTPLQWAAAGSIFVGVVCVARASESFAENPQYSRDSLRLTIGSCVLVAFVFALSFVGLKYAAQQMGGLQAVVIGRWIGVAAIVIYLLANRKFTFESFPLSWWPVIAVIGLLDIGAYIALTTGIQLPDGVFTVVVASTFSVITVLLARFILRESMTMFQWSGIALVVAGAVVLSAF